MVQAFQESITLQIENNSIISIVNVNNENELESTVYNVLEKLKYEGKYIFFTIVISDIYDNILELHNAYKKVVEMSKYRKLIEQDQVITKNNYISGNSNLLFTDEQKQKFENLLENALEQDCINIIDSIIGFNVKIGIDSFSMYLFCIDIINSCNSVLIDLYGNIPKDFPIFNTHPLLKHYDSLGEYIEAYRNIISVYSNYILSHRKYEDIIIENIKTYIEQNYNSDINMEEMADYLNISRSYMSRYFKLKTGSNLIDYLNSIRINKALELLKDNSLKITEISYMVGIGSISTFNRLFKNFTGTTQPATGKCILIIYHSGVYSYGASICTLFFHISLISCIYIIVCLY